MSALRAGMNSPSFSIHVPLVTEAEPALQLVEVASSLQIPSFHLIGLPAPEVGEARERVRAAIEASGLEFPRKRVLVNLSPASVRKRGTGIDLGIALAILAADREESYPAICWGELGLDGSIRAVGRVARALVSAWRAGAPRLFLALEDAQTAETLLPRLPRGRGLEGPPPQIISVETLTQAWEFLRRPPIRALSASPPAPGVKHLEECMPVPNHLLPLPPALERVLCLSAAGAHHLLLLGPKGSGKSHALEWLDWLAPDAQPKESLERLLLGELKPTPETLTSLSRPPFRRAGNQIRPASLCGSYAGGLLSPGEVSLAHGGTLAVDELPEWPRDAREALRGPLESGTIRLHSTLGAAELPARFQLAATGNLCPCGSWAPVSISQAICRCGVAARDAYLARIDSPVLDRIDLVQVLYSTPRDAGSRLARAPELRRRVLDVRARLEEKFGMPSGRLPAAYLETLMAGWSLPAPEAGSLRSRHKAARVALTLAYWEGREQPTIDDLREAASYRFARESR